MQTLYKNWIQIQKVRYQDELFLIHFMLISLFSLFDLILIQIENLPFLLFVVSVVFNSYFFSYGSEVYKMSTKTLILTHSPGFHIWSDPHQTKRKFSAKKRIHEFFTLKYKWLQLRLHLMHLYVSGHEKATVSGLWLDRGAVLRPGARVE